MDDNRFNTTLGWTTTTTSSSTPTWGWVHWDVPEDRRLEVCGSCAHCIVAEQGIQCAEDRLPHVYLKGPHLRCYFVPSRWKPYWDAPAEQEEEHPCGEDFKKAFYHLFDAVVGEMYSCQVNDNPKAEWKRKECNHAQYCYMHTVYQKWGWLYEE